ncbi:MAG: acetyl-CoA carboxylase carboxyltransferase subunit alpha [Acidobacteria bacterium]|jgi:acetyl-CoA carboxylase carboxyl transferase subunit alpha|nr:acetyl-CoA carboxylase carboxyltransferase subunit alpha [Acidobacteriota bacterium]
MAELDFEVPLLELQKRLDELEKWPGDPGKEREASRLRQELDAQRREIFAKLTPWQKTLVARHPNRPYALDYVHALLADWTEVKGDRRFADDPAIVCGFGLFHDRPVCLIGHQKGRDTKEKIYRNFGMPKPEGYRKALRVMRMAAKFSRPVLTFVDTPGAYPGIEAEERGQAEAIAYNLREMAGLRTPIIVTVTGEGGSGGALAVAIGDRVNMLEHAIYSVISPEGCASILFRDSSRAEEAAIAMKITAADLAGRELVDEVIEEPPGGAHVDHEELFRRLDAVLARQLDELSRQPLEELLEGRYRKFRNMGRLGREFEELPSPER